jgi:hypothetical protein
MRQKDAKKTLPDSVREPHRLGEEPVVAGGMLASPGIHGEEYARDPAPVSTENPTDEQVSKTPKAGLREARNELLKNRIERLGDRLMLHALSLFFVL